MSSASMPDGQSCLHCRAAATTRLFGERAIGRWRLPEERPGDARLPAREKIGEAPRRVAEGCRLS